MKKRILIAGLLLSQTASAGQILGSTPLYAPVTTLDEYLVVETTAGSGGDGGAVCCCCCGGARSGRRKR